MASRLKRPCICLETQMRGLDMRQGAIKPAAKSHRCGLKLTDTAHLRLKVNAKLIFNLLLHMLNQGADIGGRGMVGIDHKTAMLSDTWAPPTRTPRKPASMMSFPAK